MYNLDDYRCPICGSTLNNNDDYDWICCNNDDCEFEIFEEDFFNKYVLCVDEN